MSRRASSKRRSSENPSGGEEHANSSFNSAHAPSRGSSQAVSKLDPSALTFDALFKRHELQKAFQLNGEQVLKDAKRVKQRLNDANRLLVNPEGRMMQMWDLISFLCLFYTLLVSPYEIGFLDDYEGSGEDVLYAINMSITGVFGTDLIINFFRPYRDALGSRVKNHALIARTYLRSWFILDILSTVPFDVISAQILTSGDEAGEPPKNQRLLGAPRRPAQPSSGWPLAVCARANTRACGPRRCRSPPPLTRAAARWAQVSFASCVSSSSFASCAPRDSLPDGPTASSTTSPSPIRHERCCGGPFCC